MELLTNLAIYGGLNCLIISFTITYCPVTRNIVDSDLE